MCCKKESILLVTPHGIHHPTVKRLLILLFPHFHIYSFEYKQSPEISKLKFLTLIMSWLVNLVVYVLLTNVNYVICSHDRYGFLLIDLIKKLLKKKFILIYESHAIVSEERKDMGQNLMKIGFFKILETLIAKESDIIIALSKRICDFFSTYNRNVLIIPNLILPDIFKHRQKSKDAVREKYGFKNLDKVVGLVGPFNVFNRYALEYVYRNIDKFDNRIKFLAIGKTYDFKPMHSRIVYTEFVDNYFEHLSCVDCVLILRKIKTFGILNKILEAMALGIPVFTTTKIAEDIPYIINGGGIMAYPENSLVERMNEILFDDETLKHIGQNGKAIAKKYYVPEQYANKLITRLIESSSGKLC